jgi:two-component system cell cycle sensor histidine kinase/response regulator CckA
VASTVRDLVERGLERLRRRPAAAGWLALALALLALLLHWRPGGAWALSAAAAAALGLALFAWLKGQGALDPAARVLLAAAEASPDAALITAADGSILYANQAFRRLFPASADGGRPLAAIADMIGDDEESRDVFDRLVASAGAGVAAQGEIAIRLPAGEREWRRVGVQPMAGYAEWRALDVTARRELESVRRIEESIVTDILDNLPVGCFSADAEGRVVYANRTLADWLGTSPEAMVADGAAAGDFLAGDGKAAGGAGPCTLLARSGERIKALLVRAEPAAGDGGVMASLAVVFKEQPRVPADAGAAPANPLERLRWLFDEAPVGIAL